MVIDFNLKLILLKHYILASLKKMFAHKKAPIWFEPL
jgi:hypothetical protein